MTTASITASILWRRLDTPGHDACRLTQGDGGWGLDGMAVFIESGVPAALEYRLQCDADWRTRRGFVRGWVGGTPLAFDVERTAGGSWTLNGAAVQGLERCVDLDLGFTPATNLAQLRRVALAVGGAADVPVAWLDVTGGGLVVLAQRYDRRSEHTYWYESPSAGYAALLEVDGSGFVRRYPDLWEAVA